MNAFVEMTENEDKRLHKERKYNQKIPIDEVRKAMRMCVNGKATGLDNIKNEFMKNGGEEMRKTLVIIMNKIWDEEKVPTEWLLATITPIHKQGNKNITNNYRPISLTSVVDNNNNGPHHRMGRGERVTSGRTRGFQKGKRVYGPNMDTERNSAKQKREAETHVHGIHRFHQGI